MVTVGADGDLRDVDGCFAQAYGLSVGDWALIRPDGYVGAIIPADQDAMLENYFEHVRPGLTAKLNQSHPRQSADLP